MVATPEIRASQASYQSITAKAVDLRVTKASVNAVINFPAQTMSASQASYTVPTGKDVDIRVTQASYQTVVRRSEGSQYVKAWTFTLDGHDFYVLQLQDKTLVYDLQSEQWYVWGSSVRETWNAVYGTSWRGNIGAVISSLDTPEENFKISQVLVGDSGNGSLYFLNPSMPHDSNREGAEGVYENFERILYGQIPNRARDFLPVAGVEVGGSVGEINTSSSTTVSLSYSDDYGHTFQSAGDRNVVLESYNQRLNWRSLGSIRAPGRLFQLVDNGALKRVDRMDLYSNGT